MLRLCAPYFLAVLLAACGSNGEAFTNFRIPALAVSTQGTLLAFAEGRRLQSDHNNPTPVVLDSGRIIVLYQRFLEHFHSQAFFTGPGPAIVLSMEPCARRIVVPSCDFTGKGKDRVFSSYATYSDDAGKTWQLGQHADNPEVISANETQMVELADGRLLMSVRAKGQRMLAYNHDGGESWSPLRPQVDIPDSGAIYISADDGQSWPQFRVYHPGSFDYSSIAQLPNGDIGVLAEIDFGIEGRFNLIRFVRIKPHWLLEQ